MNNIEESELCSSHLITEGDLKWLEQLNDLVSSSHCYAKKIIVLPKGGKTGKVKKFQALNPICTAIIRIRETTKYIIQLKLKHDNICGQAFDFYELLDCISIVEGCIESLFQIIAGKQLSQECQEKNIFTKHGLPKRFDDLGYFKFIRSAAAVHPVKTDKFSKKTIFTNEFYPYALWIDTPVHKFINQAPDSADLVLKTWNSKSRSLGSKYFLYSHEFYDFLKLLLSKIKILLTCAKEDVKKYNQSLNLKKLKEPSDFRKYSDYLRYLQERIVKRLAHKDCNDGGLLILSHLFDNPLIGIDFKNELKNHVEEVKNIATTNILEIEYTDVFDWIDIGKIFTKAGAPQPSYVAEKFSDYLYKEIISEIKCNHFKFIPKYFPISEEHGNSFFVWSLLNRQLRNLFKNGELEKCKTYADLYELTLEACFLFERQ